MSWQDVPAGHQTLIIDADPFDQIGETDESNNQFPFHFFVGGTSGTVACQGVWILTERANGQVTSGNGSVVNDCDVYWGANQPMGPCWQTQGSAGMTVQWSDLDGDGCPDLAEVSAGFTYDIRLENP